jgi:hypothetical protein
MRNLWLLGEQGSLVQSSRAGRIFQELQLDLAQLPSDGILDKRVRNKQFDRVHAAVVAEVLGVGAKILQQCKLYKQKINNFGNF